MRRGHGIQICLGPRNGCQWMRSGRGTLARSGLGLSARLCPRHSANDKVLIGSACCPACSSSSWASRISFLNHRLLILILGLAPPPLFVLWVLNLLDKRTSSASCGSACSNKLSSKPWAAWASCGNACSKTLSCSSCSSKRVSKRRSVEVSRDDICSRINECVLVPQTS